MDTPIQEGTPRRKSILESAKGYLATMLGATRAKVDDFSAEVEFRTFRMLWLTVWAIVGITSLWFGLLLGVLTIIFGFHLPPKYAFGIPSLTFFVVSLVAFIMFQKTKASKRKAARDERVER